EDAERLFWAVHSGELDDCGVIGGEYILAPPQIEATPPQRSQRVVTASSQRARRSEQRQATVREDTEPRWNSICREVEEALRTSAPPRIEAFLEGRDEVDQSALLGELLLLEIAYRCEQGQIVRAEEYQRRFPNLDLDWMELESTRSDLSPMREVYQANFPH